VFYHSRTHTAEERGAAEKKAGEREGEKKYMERCKRDEGKKKLRRDLLPN
jgi:hypothetical protein